MYKLNSKRDMPHIIEQFVWDSSISGDLQKKKRVCQ